VKAPKLLALKANGILRVECNENRSWATARNEGENKIIRGVATERVKARGRKGNETRYIW